MALVTNHLDLFTITVTQDPAPAAAAGFGICTMLVDQATNTLDGEDYVDYTGSAAAVTDQASGFITAGVLKAVQTAFSQVPPPPTFRLARYDSVGAETPSVALARLIDDGLEMYGILLDDRTAAVQAALATTIQSLRMLCCFQSSDADWLTAGVPAAYSTVDGDERTLIVFHDTATEWADVAWLTNRLAYDPDEKSVAWEANLANVASYATPLTATQKTNAKANSAAVIGKLASATQHLSPGNTQADRHVKEWLTGDWIYTRVEEELAAMVVQATGRGNLIPVTSDGQALVSARLQRVTDKGQNAGHFKPGQVLITALAITAADITARRIRVQIDATHLIAGLTFTIPVNLGRDDVVAES